MPTIHALCLAHTESQRFHAALNQAAPSAAAARIRSMNSAFICQHSSSAIPTVTSMPAFRSVAMPEPPTSGLGSPTPTTTCHARSRHALSSSPCSPACAALTHPLLLGITRSPWPQPKGYLQCLAIASYTIPLCPPHRSSSLGFKTLYVMLRVNTYPLHARVHERQAAGRRPPKVIARLQCHVNGRAACPLPCNQGCKVKGFRI